MRIQLSEKATKPTKGTKFSAGWDLYAKIDRGIEAIQPHKTKKIGTGVRMEIPRNHYGQLCARSGLSTERGLRLADGIGVIDEDYRGEIFVAIHNDSDETQIVYHGDRIAQIIIVPYRTVELEIAKELTPTDRGEKGFGSTGI